MYYLFIYFKRCVSVCFCMFVFVRVLCKSDLCVCVCVCRCFAMDEFIWIKWLLWLVYVFMCIYLRLLNTNATKYCKQKTYRLTTFFMFVIKHLNCFMYQRGKNAQWNIEIKKTRKTKWKWKYITYVVGCIVIWRFGKNLLENWPKRSRDDQKCRPNDNLNPICCVQAAFRLIFCFTAGIHRPTPPPATEKQQHFDVKSGQIPKSNSFPVVRGVDWCSSVLKRETSLDAAVHHI